MALAFIKISKVVVGKNVNLERNNVIVTEEQCNSDIVGQLYLNGVFMKIEVRTLLLVEEMYANSQSDTETPAE